MTSRRFLIFVISLFIFLLIVPVLQSRDLTKNKMTFDEFRKSQVDDYWPYLTFRNHKNGRFWTTIMNNGIIGNYLNWHDYEMQLTSPDSYYPRYLRIRHSFFTALWVGGVIGTDTLVTTALDVDDLNKVYWWGFKTEFLPDPYPRGGFNSSYTSVEDDFSELDFSEIKHEAVYTDTLLFGYYVPYNEHDLRLHRPLNLEITQTSYSWEYKYAEDFLVVDFKIKNIGNSLIENGYVGLYHRGTIHYIYELPTPGEPGGFNELTGYIDSIPYEYEQLGYEQMNLAWVLDRSGSTAGKNWNPMSTRNSFGIAPLDMPKTAYNINYNWWFDNYNRSWGPRKKGSIDMPLRKYSGDFGRPLTDKEKYHMMAHSERDYDAVYAEYNMEPYGWITNFEYADDITDGFLVNYLTSFGPFNLEPNEVTNLCVVMCVGENTHITPSAYREFFDPYHPEVFMSYLDFSDLIDNIRWAKRIYDNPGVDTDNDGDSGKYFFLVDSTNFDSTQIFYTGDGVPDFKGASPPPPPEVRVSTEEGRLTVRWNGRDSENYFDSFSRLRDFEGYRVYIARSLSEKDITMLCSFDHENYNRYKWNEKYKRYDLTYVPFTKDQLKKMYGESFDPLEYSRANPLYSNGNYYYFNKVDFNASELTNQSLIHKVYPDATLDTTDVDEEGRMRYYEYEYFIEDLLPTVPYYVVVYSFDFGYPAKSLPALESSNQNNRVKVFAVDQELEADAELKVYCYPNPYKIDDDYAANGYEGRFTGGYFERERSIFFANLPPKCKISIFTLNGDLVKEIEHDQLPGSGLAGIERFDLINRSDMAIVTGLYYWVVESDQGNQIGKLVILK